MFVTLSPLGAFVALLAVHWLGDFFLQSDWMSANKSKRLDALAVHVGSYTAILFIGTALVFGQRTGGAVLNFVLLNGALHFATDFVTSRITSELWRRRHVHDFFVVLGVDQFIHQATLAATMAWLLD